MFPTWHAFYRSDLQGLYALLVVPALFLLLLLLGGLRFPGPGAEPRAAGFLRIWALVFLVETMLDPIVTGPALRRLALPPGWLADNAVLPFVLLGDFRVFALMEVVAVPERPRRAALARAAAWTLIVPLAAGVLHRALVARWGPLPPASLWLVYELLFLALAAFLGARWVPARVARPAGRAYLRAVLTYVGGYYALWAAADALILGVGADWAWGLRAVPNQLYYGLFVPFCYLVFFAPRYAATSASVHTSR